MAKRKNETRQFWLVQRLYLSPYADHKKAFPKAKVKSNPFGYGRMGDYELDYMGAAEFEFGAIGESSKRLHDSGELEIAQHEYKGYKIDFLYIKEDGDPFEDWVKWADGYTTDNGYEVRGFDGKEPPYELRSILGDWEWGPQTPQEAKTHVYWSLDDDVIWAFAEGDDEGHLYRMLESMRTEPSELLR